MIAVRPLRLTLAAPLAIALLACSPATPTRDGSAQDAIASDGASVASDGGADGAMDAARADRVEADASEPVDVVINPGMCGQSVRDCLCGCGASAQCQQTCVQGDETCSSCLFDAITQCCPMENAAVEQCIIDSMCETDACILERCGTQWSALQSCARRRESEPACQAHVRGCLGPDYPGIQCVRDE